MQINIQNRIMSKFDVYFSKLLESIRSCPICPKCGSKRFVRLSGEKIIVKCRVCDKIIEI
jgi:ribosomal protein L37AE/L43A